jgi:hypothetical protein
MRPAGSIMAGLVLLLSTLPTAASAQYWGYGHGRPPAMDYRRAGYPPRWANGPPPGYYRPPPPPAYRGRCHRGGSGAIIGAIAGGLLGGSVAGRGDRGFGTMFGAGAGALTGREIGRDC